jgi:hypothetical protein
MSRAGFEPAIPMFERPKTVPALDRSAIETDHLYLYPTLNATGVPSTLGVLTGDMLVLLVKKKM